MQSISNPAITSEAAFVRTAAELTRHLAQPKPYLYWIDSLSSATVGWLALYLCGSVGSPWGFLLFPIAIFAFYRATIFMHEVVHFAGPSMRLFHIGWNALIGVPFLMPSFVYDVHLRHHARSQYGTTEDAEYVPWGVIPARHSKLFLAFSWTLPLMALLRFLVLAPLGWLVPSFGRWLHVRASALAMRPDFRRQDPFKSSWWRLQEVGAFLWAVTIVVVTSLGLVRLRFVLLWVLAMAVGSVINCARTLAAHRYHSDERPMSFVGQFRDSVNHPEGFLAELWAPVGLRYHALHHLLPFLPYHSLGAAHRILMEKLPASVYAATNSHSLRYTLKALWNPKPDLHHGDNS